MQPYVGMGGGCRKDGSGRPPADLSIRLNLRARQPLSQGRQDQARPTATLIKHDGVRRRAVGVEGKTAADGGLSKESASSTGKQSQFDEESVARFHSFSTPAAWISSRTASPIAAMNASPKIEDGVLTCYSLLVHLTDTGQRKPFLSGSLPKHTGWLILWQIAAKWLFVPPPAGVGEILMAFVTTRIKGKELRQPSQAIR